MLSRHRKSLVALFSDLQKLRQNPEDIALCFSIQEQLVSRICRTEYRIRGLKENNVPLNRLVNHGRLPREYVLKLKAQVERNLMRKTELQNLLFILRAIGDGIAFIYLDKWDIKPFCLSKEHAGFISGKSGLRLELEFFRARKADGFPCILNDITNSLRYGDITCIKGGLPTIFEVKSSPPDRGNPRTQRQIDRARKLLKYFEDDQAEGVYPGQGSAILNRCELVVEEEHHRKKLTALIIEAFALKKNLTNIIEDGLYYHVSASVRTGLASLSQVPEGRHICAFFLNADKYVAQAYYPFTLSISNPESLFAFYAGLCVITVFIDFDVIKRELAKRGIQTSFNLDGEDDFVCLQGDAPTYRMQVSRHFFGRVAAEFLSLKWILQELAGQVERYVKKSSSPTDVVRPADP